jgi:hypothetical protein
MHADDRRGLRGPRPIDELQVDHRMPLVRIALGARMHASLTADAPARVDEEFHSCEVIPDTVLRIMPISPQLCQPATIFESRVEACDMMPRPLNLAACVPLAVVGSSVFNRRAAE